MNSVDAEKEEIRARMKALRRAVPPDERAARSAALCARLLARVGSAKLVCCYRALKTELDLSAFVARCGVDVVYPEKVGDGYAVPRANDVDLWICPGLAFTGRGERLGFGGGWYDRFLAAAKPTARKIGVAYGFQKCERLPQGPWDILLDEVVWA